MRVGLRGLPSGAGQPACLPGYDLLTGSAKSKSIAGANGDEMGALDRGLMSAIAVVLLAGAASPARSCDADTIDSIADDGSIIVMTSGASFRVSPFDQTDATFWLAEDDVLICRDQTEIINTNAKHERIHVSRIR